MPQAMMIMSIAQAGASFIGGQQQAAAQARYANEQSKAAWDNYYVQRNQLEQEAIQQSNQTMMEKSERAKQLLIEQSKISTIAGESGIGGSSVNALLQDSYVQAGIDISTMENNRLSRQMQNASQTRSSYARAKQTSAEYNQQAQSAYDKAPTLLGTALQIGGAVEKYKNR